MLKHLLIAGFGGAIGTMLRYGISAIGKQYSFYPTLLINIVGCLFIGIIMGIALKQNTTDSKTVVFLVTGVCGGFTTFSAFSYENFILLQQGKFVTALLYIIISIVAGILATFLGYKLAY